MSSVVGLVKSRRGRVLWSIPVLGFGGGRLGYEDGTGRDSKDQWITVGIGLWVTSSLLLICLAVS